MHVAIIGCGSIAETHAQVLSEMGHTIALCVDRSLQTAERFAARWSAKQFSDDVAQIFRSQIDAVHICTPPPYHYELAKACIAAGLHIVCEKPLCLDDAQAEELNRLAEEAQIVHAVGFNVRFHLACQQFAQSVKRDEFGRIYMVNGSYLQEFHAFPAPLDWRYDSRLAGKMRAVTEIGSHWFDLAEYISGKRIVAVSALFGNFNPDRFVLDGVMNGIPSLGAEKTHIDSEDAAVISMKFSDGSIGSTVLSEVTHGRINRLELQITGERASLWWNSEENNHIHIGRKNQGIQTEVLGFGTGFADTHRHMFAEIYRDIEQGKPSEKPLYATFADGCHIVKLCNAAYKSATDGSKWVPV